MSRIPVVIAGGGTVGLATAAFLGHHGVTSLVVERRTQPSQHPRALGVTRRTLEYFRELGLDAELRRVVAHPAQFWRATARTAAEIDRDRSEETNSWAGQHISPVTPQGHYPQNRLDAVLEPAARDRGAVIERGVGVTGVAQDADTVTVSLSDGRAWHADYLVAADGANSTVRCELGIATTGPGEIGDVNMNILFDADLIGRFGSMPTMTEIRHPDVEGLLLAVAEQRWVLHTRLPPGDSLSNQQCADIVRTAIGADVPVRIVSTIPWRATVRMADQFRCGRVFLVGDAAHSNTPLGAFGLNTGMADAHNLAWKLAAVRDGRAGDGLLDTYHDERHAVAELVTRQSMLRWENPRLHWDPTAVDERAAVGAWNAPLVTMGYRYESAAVIDPVVHPPSTEDLVESLDGAPGSHIPHRWITPETSTVDLNRSGFAVLAGPNGEAWCASARTASAALGFDVTTAHLTDEAAAACHLGEHGALLVRPDGFIAWRTQGPADATMLQEVLEKVTARR